MVGCPLVAQLAVSEKRFKEADLALQRATDNVQELEKSLIEARHQGNKTEKRGPVLGPTAMPTDVTSFGFLMHAATSPL